MPPHVRRVLLVDDHVPIRITLRRMLTGYDDVHVVGEACDGKQAIELVPLYQPHVVVMDFYMPRMNGVEAARLIKKSSGETVIIGLCSVPNTYITDEFLKAGALAVILKDRIEHLHSTIQRAFPKRASSDHLLA
jgi:DNA-binding NarL/FixJ family response regulator